MSGAGSVAGVERLTGKFARGVKAFWMCVIVFCVVGGAGGWVVWSHTIANWPAHEKAVPVAAFKRFIMGAHWNGFTLQARDLLHPSKRNYRMPNDPRILDRWLNSRWSKMKPKLMPVAYSSTGAGTLAVIFFLTFAVRNVRGRSLHKRGAKLLTNAQLNKEVKKTRGKSTYSIAGVPMPFESQHQMIYISGTTGSGKSQAINDLLKQIRKNGDMALVYDPGGEFYSTLSEPGDMLLNPLDERSEPWDVMTEIQSPMDAENIAFSAVQGSVGADNEYFFDGARKALAAVLCRIKTGMIFEDPYSVLTKTPPEQLAEMLRGTEAFPMLDPKAKGNGAGGIISTLSTKIGAWKYLRKNGTFSIRKWVRKEGDGWLFLTSIDDQAAVLSPLISLWVDIAAREILSREPRQGKAIYLIIDELSSLSRLPSLEKVLAMGRKYRVVVVLATQSPAQLEKIYKREGMRAILGCVGTKAVFRTEDADDADATSKYFGDHEVCRENVSENASKSMRGASFSRQHASERIIMASEIQALPDLTAYLKLAGGLPATKVKMKYVANKQVVARCQRREVEFEPVGEKGVKFTIPKKNNKPKRIDPIDQVE